MHKLFIQILLYLPCLRNHWLIPFYIAFSDLVLGLVLHGQQKAKHFGFILSLTEWDKIKICFIFSLTEQLNATKMNVVMMHPDAAIEGNCTIKRNDCCDCVKNFDVCMHSNSYEQIWFNLGLLANATELYILILVYMILTLIQGYSMQESKKKKKKKSFEAVTSVSL